MSNITFDTEGKVKTSKEDIEWLRIWCEETNDSLPRVALIGDSITEGYFRLVQKAFEGIARVDYLATSYSVESEIYKSTVKALIDDSDYAVVHYNYGLHAYSVNEDRYEKGCREMLAYISKRAKTVVGTTTTVLNEDLKTESVHWKDKVRLRNERLLSIAADMGLSVDDLNKVSKDLAGDNRTPDGVHFSENGYQVLAKSVVESIKKIL